MPMVNGKQFPYTKAGKAAAMKAKKKNMMSGKAGMMPTPTRMKPKIKPKMKKGY
jgi:FMN-dependent NADH-azoreductase